MDEFPSAAASPAPSPAKGRTSAMRRGRGRGLGKGLGRKPNTTSTATHFRRGGGRGRGRGRNKTYTDSRVQAAYERQRELRELYSEVASAVKPALEELADQNLKLLLENPVHHKEVAEYEGLQSQLDAHFAEACRVAETKLKANLGIAKRTFDLNMEFTKQSYIVSPFSLSRRPTELIEWFFSLPIRRSLHFPS